MCALYVQRDPVKTVILGVYIEFYTAVVIDHLFRAQWANARGPNSREAENKGRTVKMLPKDDGW